MASLNYAKNKQFTATYFCF